MYLDKHNKILFPGDNICADISGCGSVSYPLEECSLYKYRECVRKLVNRMDEIDWVFPMHFMCDLENRILPAVLEALDATLSTTMTTRSSSVIQQTVLCVCVIANISRAFQSCVTPLRIRRQNRPRLQLLR